MKLIKYYDRLLENNENTIHLFMDAMQLSEAEAKVFLQSVDSKVYKRFEKALKENNLDLVNKLYSKIQTQKLKKIQEQESLANKIILELFNTGTKYKVAGNGTNSWSFFILDNDNKVIKHEDNLSKKDAIEFCMQAEKDGLENISEHVVYTKAAKNLVESATKLYEFRLKDLKKMFKEKK